MDDPALAAAQSSAPCVSVVSVTYHTGTVLFTMIASILAQPQVLELVLVNNGNPDAVVEQLLAMAKAEPRLIVQTGQGNVGFATGTNRGARLATGAFILVLNPDCIAGEGFVAGMLTQWHRLRTQHPQPLLLSCRILDAQGKEQSGSRRALLTPWRAFSEVFGLYKIAPNHPWFQRFKWHEAALPTENLEVPATSGALMLLSKNDYWGVGGFDEGYFLHVDDLDLCLRFTRNGGKVFFTPHVCVTHVGATSQAPKYVVERHKTRSFVRYFFKNFSHTTPRLFLYLVAAGVWLRFFVLMAKQALRQAISRSSASRSHHS